MKATTNNTRHFASERMFFLPQNDFPKQDGPIQHVEDDNSLNAAAPGSGAFRGHLLETQPGLRKRACCQWLEPDKGQDSSILLVAELIEHTRLGPVHGSAVSHAPPAPAATPYTPEPPPAAARGQPPRG